jgi:hypothetical protein
MAEFSRTVDESLLEQLVASSLFQERLKHDLNPGEPAGRRVFPAFRHQRVDFYYRGGKLLGFRKGQFSTHQKYYATILNPKSDYVSEQDLPTLRWPSSFEEAYERMKENCRRYSGDEAEGVAELYSRHSYLLGADIVVLDIEVQFEHGDEPEDDWPNTRPNDSAQQDRIDLLLYNTETRTLRFVEAKHSSNREIRAQEQPKVLEQLRRYRKVLSDKDARDRILEQYSHYVDYANRYFAEQIVRSLPEPEFLMEDVGLLVFGMDEPQKKYFNKHFLDKYRDPPTLIQNVTGLNLSTLF